MRRVRAVRAVRLGEQALSQLEVPGARRVLALALPALGALAADPLLSLIDTAFVGRLGAVPLAALGVDTALFGFAFAIFNFLAYATTPMVATARGRRDVTESGQVVRRALVIAWGIGVASAAFFFLAAHPLIGLMQAAPEVVDPAMGYLRVRAIAIPALLLITVGHGAYRGFQDTRTPLYVSLAVNVLNAVLDPILIFTLGFGIEGAALATVIAQWIGALVFLRLLSRKAKTEQWPTGRVRLWELRAFAAVGGMLTVRTVLLVATLTAATATAARVGTIEVAAHQIVSQVWFLLAMTVDALAIAAQAMVADLVGRDRHAAARTLSNRLLWWGLLVGVVLGAILAASTPWLGGWFSDDPTVIQATRSVIPIAAGMQPLAALVFVLDGVFLAVLATRRLAGSTAAGFVVAAGIFVATLWQGWGLNGVWWGITAMVIARGAVLGWAYRSMASSS